MLIWLSISTGATAKGWQHSSFLLFTTTLFDGLKFLNGFSSSVCTSRTSKKSYNIPKWNLIKTFELTLKLFKEWILSFGIWRTVAAYRGAKVFTSKECLKQKLIFCCNCQAKNARFVVENSSENVWKMFLRAMWLQNEFNSSTFFNFLLLLHLDTYLNATEYKNDFF